MRSLLATLALLALAALGACQQTRLTQVLPPGMRVDVFPQVSRAQLDALFVIDNSRYMAVHQKRVADSMGRFVAWLDKTQIDWHIGLVTTDVSNAPGAYVGGGAQRYFTPAEAGALAPSVQAIGGTGAAIAAALQQLELALAGPPPGFLRPGADLFLVAVTDNNDPWSPGDDQYYFRVLKAAKGRGNDGIVSLSALAGPPPDGCKIPDPQNPAQTFFAEPAPRLKGLVERMGGRFASLCEPAFDVVFDELGAQAAGLKRAFRLARPPDLSSLAVRVRARCDTRTEALAFCAALSDECGEASPARVCTPRAAELDGWSWDASTESVLFHGAALPPRGSTVEVQYKEAGASP